MIEVFSTPLPSERFLNRRTQWIAEDLTFRSAQLQQSKNELAEAMNWSALAGEKVTNPEIALLVRRRNRALRNGNNPELPLNPKLSLDQEAALDKFIRVREDYRKGQATKQRLEKQAVGQLLPIFAAPNHNSFPTPLDAELLTPSIAPPAEKRPFLAKLRGSFDRAVDAVAKASIKQILFTSAAISLFLSGAAIAYESGAGKLPLPKPTPIHHETALPPSAAIKYLVTPRPEAMPTPAKTPEPAQPPITITETKPSEETLVAETPPRYREAIIQAAHQYQIPPRLLSALLSKESRFDPNARSEEGSEGIAQMQAATAKMLGVNQWNPTESIYGAAKYLRYLYNRFGNWEEALAAYNAGPTVVAEYGGVPPYSETKKYTETILNRMQIADSTSVN